MRMSDKPSELPTSRRENVGADDNSTISARLAQICYILVCLKILFFYYLAIVDSNIYVLIVDEDSWVENLTAVVFLLTGIVLFAAGLIERSLFPRCVYFLGGMTMLFFVGEEISWGQRIIGFGTPDFLVGLNNQKETTIHNIRVVSYNSFLKPALFALCIAASAASFCRKDRIFGVPLPPIFLTLAVLATMSFIYGQKVELLEILRFIESPLNALFLFLLLFALFSRNARLFITIAAPMSVSLAVPYLIDQHSYIPFRTWLEWHEYLFSVVCFFYALAALLDHGVARQKIMSAVAALKPARTHPSMFVVPFGQIMDVFVGIKWSRLTPWTLICLLIIAGSIGLAFATYFKARAELAAFKEIYLLARTTEPTARSNFDVYIDGRELHYFKQPCGAMDVDAPFFLAIFPDDVDVLPDDRRRHGFANHDFYFLHFNPEAQALVRRKYGYMLDGACAATARLPDYEIARISTGQYTFDDNGVATNLWIAEFPVGGE